MKLLLSLCILLLTTSCATGVIKDGWTKSLIGKTGYIREPVQIVKDDKKKWAPFAEFKRCEQVEVVEARAYGKNTGIVVKQDGKLFYIWSAERFVNDFKNNPTEATLHEYIAPTLDAALGEKTTVKLTTGTYDSHELQCKNTYWVGMTAQQLMFVKGRPDSIDRTKTKTGFKAMWSYNQKDSQATFELENDIVTMWQD